MPTVRITKKLDGSGTAVVIAKFAAVKVGIAVRPSGPFRFNMRARIFKSALLSLRSVENTKRGKIETLVEVDEESRTRCCDLACDQIGCVTGSKRR